MDLIKCCFAGHSEVYDDVLPILREKIIDLIINENVKEFWVGNYGQFDHICAKYVRGLKNEYQGIKLCLVIPYITKSINEFKEQYYELYDSIIMADMPENTPTRYRILKCNEYMVNECDFLICYVKYSWGGAAKTLQFAEKNKMRIINIANLK